MSYNALPLQVLSAPHEDPIADSVSRGIPDEGIPDEGVRRDEGVPRGASIYREAVTCSFASLSLQRSMMYSCQRACKIRLAKSHLRRVSSLRFKCFLWNQVAILYRILFSPNHWSEACSSCHVALEFSWLLPLCTFLPTITVTNRKLSRDAIGVMSGRSSEMASKGTIC